VEPLWDHAKWVEEASKAVVDGKREDKPRRRRGTVETVQTVSPRVRCMIIRRIYIIYIYIYIYTHKDLHTCGSACPQGLIFSLPRLICLIGPRQRLELSPRGPNEGEKHTAGHTSPTEGRRRRASRGQQSGQMTREEAGAVRHWLSPEQAREGRKDDEFEAEPVERGSGGRRRRGSARETDNLRYHPSHSLEFAFCTWTLRTLLLICLCMILLP
jgi:hypothetical protein